MSDTDKLMREFAREARKKLKAAAKKFRKGKAAGTIREKTVRVNGRTFQAKEAVLRESVRTKTHRLARSPHIDRVKIEFSYHGVFVERGKGKGKRTAKPWFNPTIQPEITKLADEVGELWADMAVKGVLL